MKENRIEPRKNIPEGSEDKSLKNQQGNRAEELFKGRAEERLKGLQEGRAEERLKGLQEGRAEERLKGPQEGRPEERLKDAPEEQQIKEIRKKGYHETKKHADEMFAFNVYPCTIPGDFQSVHLHWQDSVEIVYVKKGRGIAQIDLLSFTVEEGDIVFILPGQLHGLRQYENDRMEYENIIFDMSFLGAGTPDLCSRKYLNPLINGQLCLPPKLDAQHPDYEKLASCLDEIDSLRNEKQSGYELGVKAGVYKLMSLLFLCGILQKPSDENPANIEKLKEVLSVIRSDYNRKIAVEEMADLCGYTTGHFMRWFKKVTGISFVHYLNSYRLDQACIRLRRDEETILQISEECGFDNLSNFNRLFKKYYKVTPREYRKHCVEPGNVIQHS